MADQPEALFLADAMNCVSDDGCGYCMPCRIAAELRRLAAIEAERDALRADAERYRWLASRASKDTAYDRYGNGALWSIGFFADDSRHGLGAAIDAAKGGGNG